MNDVITRSQQLLAYLVTSHHRRRTNAEQAVGSLRRDGIGAWRFALRVELRRSNVGSRRAVVVAARHTRESPQTWIYRFGGFVRVPGPARLGRELVAI